MTSPSAPRRLIPIIIALPIFLQNLTSTVIATALPTIAKSFNTDPLHLNLAVTLYLLSLAIFLPLSGWLADRHGARRVFCWAIVLFSMGSLACALSTTLWQLAAARMLQGAGGAAMVPVGRLILLRTIPKSEMVAAMVWFTIPGAFGSIVGPLLGGLIVTYFSWPWIFLVNIPFALLAIVLALYFIKMGDEEHTIPFDFVSYLLMALSLSGLLLAMVTSGRGLLLVSNSATLLMAGVVCAALYIAHAKRADHPVIDFSLLRFPTFRAAIVGGMMIRVGLAAIPFLIPLMLQIGFGVSPLAAGVLTFAWALGSLFTRPILSKALQRVGFRRMLIGTTVLTSTMYFIYGRFQPSTPHLVIFLILLLGGSARGMLMVSVNTLGFSEIPAPRMSYASVLSSMAQQVSMTFGVALSVLLLNLTLLWHGNLTLSANDFWPTFTVISMISMCALLLFIPLDKNVGMELTDTSTEENKGVSIQI